MMFVVCGDVHDDVCKCCCYINDYVCVDGNVVVLVVVCV